MLRSLLGWLDHRTGWKGLLHEVLFERVPGGARWRYIWGSALSFTFVIQVLSGIVLWAAYSPSSQTAWESVFYIQHEMWGGWLVRGIHHFTAQAMNILLVLHLLQVVLDGAYRAPREMNFWFGLLMLQVVLALSLTGYLLPWDQKGYWATRVATNIVGITPLVGRYLQQILVGGTEYGHHTLTRFFALHAGVLPGALVLLTVAHIMLFRRHGIKAREPFKKPDAYFWPDQLLLDSAGCLGVMVVVVLAVLCLGTPLDAPADPANPFTAARPEWYFLFLFQFLKLFRGETGEIIGAIIIPGLIFGAFFLMPLLAARWRAGHALNLAFIAAVLCGVGLLTWVAIRKDRGDAAYLRAVAQTDRDAERARVLARSPAGISESGARVLLRSDPYTVGPRLFSQHCSSCHRFGGQDGLGGVPNGPAAASDLKGFASREWLAALLSPETVDSTNYFGATRFKDGKMVRFVKRDIAKFADPEKHNLSLLIKALSSEAALPAQKAQDERDAAEITAGREALASDAMRCTECHEFHRPNEDSTGPVLTGYGSRDWLIRFITDPSHASFYGKRNDRMPEFGAKAILGRHDIELIADWLRGDWYVPAGLAEK